MIRKKTAWKRFIPRCAQVFSAALFLPMLSAAAAALPYCGDGGLRVGGECIHRVVPVVVSTPGALGSFFRTSVSLISPNRNNAPPQPPSPNIAGRLVFHPAGQTASDADPSIGFTLDFAQVQTFPDVVQAFGRQGLGSLDIVVSASSNYVPIGPEVFVEIYNDAAAGRPSAAEDAVDPSERTTDPHFAQVLSVYSDGVLAVPDTQRRRFHLGIRTLNATSPCQVFFTLIDGQTSSAESTAYVATATRTYPPNFLEQVDATTLFGTRPSAGQWVHVVTRGCPTIAYGVSVDNQTNSPSIRILREAPFVVF